MREPPDDLLTWNQPAEPKSPPDEGLRHAVLELLGTVAVSVDEIVRQSGAPAAAVVGVILELELAGRVHREAGGGICLA